MSKTKNKVTLTLTRYKRTANVRSVEHSEVFGPFDWIEVEVPVIIAEAQDGDKRFEQLAVLYTPVANYHWKTKDGKAWHDFVVSPWTGEHPEQYPG